MNNLTLGLAACLTAGVFVTSAMAGVPASQANRLGQDLTPMGSEKAGSGDIPAWSGGLSSIPAGVSVQAGEHLPNPFSGDSVKFTITGANMGQYADNLTEGYKLLLSTYPSYKMNVYQGRRTCAYPDSVYASTRNNAEDRKSTRLNSSHDQISYAVFCLKKKKHREIMQDKTERV